MKTPIYDFLITYEKADKVRLHMPGHKGLPFLGCEKWDITEVAGADALYEAEGIIAQSEENAAVLFGTQKTFFVTEGSSQTIRAMVHLAAQGKEKPWFLAARNAHKAFLYALALCDAEVTWLWPEKTDSVCACPITAEQVEEALRNAETVPAAVYVTSPDYLGNELPIKEIAEVCHKYGTLLLVDNAHGAYLRFLPVDRHPITLGADLCCDSAHKTLPVLTGGAYLHISKVASKTFAERGRQALALFGSTSPSYLTLASLDLCNLYLEEKIQEDLQRLLPAISKTKEMLMQKGWEVTGTEPMKITIRCAGTEIADRLRKHNIECEYADRDFLVLMPSAQTAKEDLSRLLEAIGENTCSPNAGMPELSRPDKAISPRRAMFASWKWVNTEESEGRIAAAPTVGCPPAVPIVVSGERIDKKTAELLTYYGFHRVAVVTHL